MRVPVYYGDYLRLDRLLSSQEPESAKIGINAHDAMRLPVPFPNQHGPWRQFCSFLVQLLQSVRDHKT